MGELAAAVAHELNQPLTAAGTYTRLVDDAIGSGNGDPKMIAETAKKAVAQVERAAEVVRRLRALVRLDRSNRASWKVERAVKDTIELCQPDIDRHHVTVRSLIPNDLPSVMIDLLQIEQVLINVVRNAVDALGENQASRRVVSHRGEGGGRGLHRTPRHRHRTRLFPAIPRQRLRAARLHQGRGPRHRPLALQVDHRGAWRHPQARGRRARRRRPLHPADRKERMTMAKPIQIALIDDDEAVLNSLSLYFRSQQVATAGFATAQDFLAALGQEKQFDCIVSDVRMPGMSGLDLVRELKSRNVGTPIVLITGHGDVDMAVAAIKVGAADFIEKPFDESRLLVSVRHAIAESQQREKADQQNDLPARFESLTARQRQVMELAVAGLSNKEIGAQLKISPKTVENHRAWVMERIGARNIAELVRMAMKYDRRTAS